MTRHVSLVTLLVPDYEAGLAFYVEQLGFDVIEDKEMGGDKRWVVVAPKTAATAILLARAIGPDQSAAIGNQTGGRVGFFLATDDFTRDHAAMTAKGVRFLEARRDEPYGKVAVFVDPFGNKWDLIEPA